MRPVFTFLLILIYLPLFAQPGLQKKIDSVTGLIQEYYNKKDAESLYSMAGAEFKKQLSEETFTQTLESLHQQIGKITSLEFESLNGTVAKYKAGFTNQFMSLLVGLDDADKLETLLLQQYEAPPPPKDDSTIVPARNPLRTELDKLVDSLVSPFMRRNNTVGLAMGILNNGQTHVYGYGEKEKGKKQIPAGNTLFEIGSVSKTFTATLLAYFVQQGKIKLDDPVNKYLPDSVAKLEYNGKPVTVASLSNHSSGLPRLPADLFQNADPVNPYKHYDNKKLFSYLAKFKPTREPGERYEYSNLAVGLLGVILERISGKSYETLLKEIIWQPLQMNATRLTLGKADSAFFAQGYSANVQPAHSWEFQSLAAAGGIRSNINDMLLYAKAQVAGNEHAALQKAIQLTHRQTYKNGQTEVALGWHFINGPGGKQYLGHNGQTGGYCSIMVFNPLTKKAVVILTNASVQASAIAITLLNRIDN